MKKATIPKKSGDEALRKFLDLEMKLLNSLSVRLTTVEAQYQDLHKMLKSHELILAEHQRVLRILFNEQPDKKPN